MLSGRRSELSTPPLRKRALAGASRQGRSEWVFVYCSARHATRRARPSRSPCGSSSAGTRGGMPAVNEPGPRQIEAPRFYGWPRQACLEPTVSLRLRNQFHLSMEFRERSVGFGDTSDDRVVLIVLKVDHRCLV